MKKSGDPRVVPFPRVQRLVEENRGLARRLEEMTDACRALQDEISILSDLLGPFASSWQESTGNVDRMPRWWEILEWLVAQYSSSSGSRSGG